MKPQELSKKLNPLGEIMDLPDAFNQLKNTKHDSSFENLGDWLNQNTSKPKKMKTFYKIAASLTFATMVLIACTVPVQHEEEIGYMIKGISTAPEGTLVESMKKAKVTFGKQIVMSYMINEIDGQDPIHQGEIVLLLPDADEVEARSKMEKLNATFKFDTIDLLPIEEVVEKPLYESALSQVNINFGKGLSEEVIIERFNKVLHENSNVAGKATLNTDEEGNKVVEIIIEESEMNGKIKGALNELDPKTIKSITISEDENGNKVIDMDIKEEVKN
jgi:hypothetical protein